MEQQGPLKVVTIFRITMPLCAVIAVFGIVWPQAMGTIADVLTRGLFQALDWFWLASVTCFLLLAFWLALSRYGQLRLGRPGDRPEFSTVSWISMLFAAGMGAGLLFWGVAEPVTHFATPPVGAAGTPEAARQAMVLTNFHWGLHAWGIYCIGALVLAYYGFRKGAPYLAGTPIRRSFTGIWVEPVAVASDVIAVVAVAFGVAASVGQGSMQIVAGLNVLVGVPVDSVALQVGLLVALFIAYMTSAGTGLKKGIKWLSNLNMGTAVLLLFFLLFVGPTGFLLRTFVTSLGDYVSALPGLSLRLYPYQDLGGWVQSWTLTYFVWWIAWAPFVGIFIARISRGRTIREFVIGTILVPAVFSVLWFAIFGGVGIHEELFGSGGIARLVQEDVTVALFTLFERFPLSEVCSGIALMLVFIFLVTSVDSATFVLGMLTTRGSLEPPLARKFTWGVTLGVLSAALHFLGDIHVLRSVLVSGSVPYSLIMLIQAGALLRSLTADNPLAARAERGREARGR
jgi:glycine betaine transporter